MTPQPETTLSLQDVSRLFSKYWVSILLTTILSSFFCLLVANHLTKKYKAYFVLTIYPNYFQSPLVGDFVPELSDSGEARSQRESLIRQVLTPEYLDSLGQKYGIYGSSKKDAPMSSWLFRLEELGQGLGLFQPGSKDSLLSAEREELRSRIEIDSQNNTTFKIGFLYSDPAITLQVTQDIYDHVIQNLLELRMRKLSNIRDAIQNRVATMSPTVTAAAPPTTAPAIPTGMETVETELASVRNQIQSLTSQYTEEHPLVIQLRDRERLLVERLATMSAESSSGHALHRVRTTVGGASADTSRDIYGDLSKKLNYLNIAIESDREHQSDYFATLEPPLYPSSALWPKKGLLALWGIALGLFGSLFISAIREYFDRSTLHAAELAHQLNVPLLGELPAFPPKAAE